MPAPGSRYWTSRIGSGAIDDAGQGKWGLAEPQARESSLLLGFVLGPLMELYLRRTMLLSRGDPAVFIERPISAAGVR